MLIQNAHNEDHCMHDFQFHFVKKNTIKNQNSFGKRKK